jgi:hypothetical protein
MAALRNLRWRDRRAVTRTSPRRRHAECSPLAALAPGEHCRGSR